ATAPAKSARKPSLRSRRSTGYDHPPRADPRRDLAANRRREHRPRAANLALVDREDGRNAVSITTDRDAKAQIINAIEATGVATSDEYDIDRILRLAFDFQM